MPIKKTPIIDINPTQFKNSFSSNRKREKAKEPVCPECGTNIYRKYGYVEYSQSIQETGQYTKNEEWIEVEREPGGEAYFSCPECGTELSPRVVDEVLHLR